MPGNAGERNDESKGDTFESGLFTSFRNILSRTAKDGVCSDQTKFSSRVQYGGRSGSQFLNGDIPDFGSTSGGRPRALCIACSRPASARAHSEYDDCTT